MDDNAELIKEIAENLYCGDDCFYNRETKEIVTLPNFSAFDEDEYVEAFQDQIDRVNAKENNFLKFPALTSNESYEIMESFMSQMDDQNFKLELSSALTRKSPFKNFKYLVDNSNYRQQWFDFKQAEIEKIVRELLE